MSSKRSASPRSASPRSASPRSASPKPKKQGAVRYVDSIQGITKPAITRLARVAGIKTMNGLMYEEMRGYIRAFMEEVLRKTVSYTDHARRMTVFQGDVFAALPVKMYSASIPDKGCKVYSPNSKRDGPKVKKASHDALAYREISFYQKQSSCLHIPRAPFDRLAREIAHDYKPDVRFAADAVLLLQYATEAYMVGMLRDSNLEAIHAKRQVVMPKDVSVARKVRGERQY